MKILVISASAGAGHVRAGNALLEHLKITHPEWETQHIDMVPFLSGAIRRLVVDSYDKMAKNAPKWWQFIYEKTSNKNFIQRGKFMLIFSERMASRKLTKAILNFTPDLIICTHPLALDLVNVNQKKLKHIPLFVITTDYGIHPFWGAHNVTRYFVASPAGRDTLIDYGVSADKIILSGIPISPIFFEMRKIQDQTSKNTGTERKNILIMSGGGGFTEIDKIVEIISQQGTDLNIVAVAGRNEELREKLETIKPTNPSVQITPLGWTNEIHKYLFDSDIVISKPGGITTTECYVANKPLIAIDPIPGQEDANAQFIEENHLGVIVTDKNLIWPAIKNLLSRPHCPEQRHFPHPQMIIEEIEKTLA
ncbi:MAG TPA: glycosyltransferase [Candidatus Magasanikbacteria bacterium]|nr:glycosyltransferase [Candidatus Magasanikbacteria bacterium]